MNFTISRNKKPTNSWTAPIEDVKQQLGQHVDHLAQVAAQVGRDVAAQAAQISQDAGAQAATVARDISGQAVKATQGAGSQAASVAKDVPVGAATLAQQAIKGASQLGKELRSIRVTREPVATKRGPDVIPGVALLAGLGGGLALMYFFDPERGKGRRALLRDQLTKWTRIGQKTASGKATDLKNRTQGLAHEAKKVVTSIGSSEQTTEHNYQSTATNGYTNGDALQQIPVEGDAEERISSEVA